MLRTSGRPRRLPPSRQVLVVKRVVARALAAKVAGVRVKEEAEAEVPSAAEEAGAVG